MRHDSTFVRSVGTSVPPSVDIEGAVDAGTVSRKVADRSRMRGVTVADPGVTPLHLAFGAARQALDRGAATVDEVAFLTFSVLTTTHREMANPVAWLHRQLGGQPGAVAPIEVRCGCDGAVNAMELAALYVSRLPGRLALITAADTFPDVVTNRWGLPSAALGDGGSALVLSGSAGDPGSGGAAVARLIATYTYSDPAFEVMHRGLTGFGLNPFPIDALSRVRDSFASGRLSREALDRGRDDGMRQVVAGALRDAGDLSLSGIAYVLYSNIGHDLFVTECLAPLDIPVERTTWEAGRDTGHMGPADPFFGVDHLLTTGKVGPGDRVVVIGAGAGHIWTAAVLEILRVPGWSAATAYPPPEDSDDPEVLAGRRPAP